MSQFKGFGSVPQQKLIKEWLLPECQKHYTDNAYNVDSLKTSINIMVGYFSQRKIDLKDGFEARVSASTGAFGMICQIDSDLESTNEEELKSLLDRLRGDNDFYIEFIEHLYLKVKDRVVTGDFEGLNILIKQSTDYKEWLAETGVASAGIVLKNGWVHPLTEVYELNGEEVMNTWGMASTICAVATGRLPDGDKEKMISILLSEGVLEMETFESQIKFCSCMDALYLQLVNDLNSKIENEFEKAFS